MSDPITTRKARAGVVVGCAIVMFVVLQPEPVDAQWHIEPVIKAGGETDDNATLTTRTDDVIDLSGFLFDLSAKVTYTSPRTDFFVTPRLLSRNYPDNEDIDSDDQFLNSKYSFSTESNTFSLRTHYDRQTVRTAERSDTDLDIDDPGDIPDDGSGIVGLQDRRQKLRLRPGWTHHFSNITSFGIDADWFDVNYDDSLQLFLNDYNDTRLNLSFRRGFSERTDGIVTATGRHFETKDGAEEADGLGFMAGFETRLSEKMRLKVLAGVEDTENTAGQSNAAVVGDIVLTRRLETVTLLAQYRRSISASGSGLLSVRDSFNLNLTRKLSEKISAGLGARAYRTSSLDDVVTLDEREYIQLRGRFSWRLSKAFWTELDYRYTFQNRSVLLESANSNQINVWFIYAPNSLDR